MKWLTEEDIECIAVGATVLGTGGGGDPYIGKMMALSAIQQYGPVEVITVDELKDDQWILPASGMGSPSVLVEKIPSFEQLAAPLKAFEKASGKKTDVVMPIEIGGVNSLIPVAVAAMNNIPILDGDAMGRAFPEAQMVTFHLDGLKPELVTLGDEQGNVVTIEPADGYWSEKISRNVTISMGGSSIVCDYGITGKQAKESVIPGTLTLAKNVGGLLRGKRESAEHPISQITRLLNGHILFKGKAALIKRKIEGGFTRGEAHFEGLDNFQDKSATLFFQNEHLLAEMNGKPVAMTPDLIAVLDEETGMPITTEGLKYGARVVITAFPAHEKWRTDMGIETAGPRYFKYPYDYIPLETLVKERLDK
ncbi:DUF917 family protein [Bacillus thermophilus]|uniref:DUF917 family protein n=1 Tax=Siminovitchia thermophila TaxID=1245522 RepID=A0ABS2R7Z9_9BACI|nr:DUF917 domain-containing protein [Siminovitchia thermophila]MBM7715782.1 DUF917 family protein [Siminovitchia thermophila]ONK23559.1 hypothetical protein BLX87_10065 [Bacillus sp. VT-16-64]